MVLALGLFAGSLAVHSAIRFATSCGQSLGTHTSGTQPGWGTSPATGEREQGGREGEWAREGGVHRGSAAAGKSGHSPHTTEHWPLKLYSLPAGTHGADWR